MKLIRQNTISTLAILLLVISAKAQDYNVNVFPSRLNLSFETIAMDNESDLGFLGTGFEILSISKKLSSLYFGLHSYSAITGNRPGLITLGMTTGLKLPLVKKHKLFVDGGFFLGGGGGGNAADGGGLILRPHLNLEKQFGAIGIRVGYSQINFPSGEIKGSQFNVGLTLNGSSYLKSLKQEIKTASALSLSFKNVSLALVGTYYFGLSEDSISRGEDDGRFVGLVGAQVEYEFTDNFYGIAKINGALLGGVDGYMSIFLGGGARLPVIKNRFNLETRLLFGPTGGGNIESGGGATLQYEVGPSVYFNNNYFIKLMVGKTKSPWGDLDTNHFEFALGKSFERLLPKLSKEQTEFSVPKKHFSENHISLSVYNRTYFSPNANDKSGNPYQEYFNLLSFEGQKYIGERFTLNAATVWAYQGDYGAYAEGLIGAGYHYPIASGWNVSAKALFGAAGGGGIDLGSGLVFQSNAGIEKKLGKYSNVFVNFGKYIPLKGNFDPYSLDIGFAVDIYQLFKKEE